MESPYGARWQAVKTPASFGHEVIKLGPGRTGPSTGVDDSHRNRMNE